MAKLTLLQIVQDILSDMDSDEVNSIDDTYESEQVAQIVKSTYYAMMSNRNWPHLKKLIQFDASGDTSQPTHMTLPDGLKELIFLNYNKVEYGDTAKNYQEIKYLSPDAFLRRCNLRDSDDDDVDTIQDDSGIELLILNDTAPTYYTTFDEEVVVFDSYDSEVDTTLQASKVQALGYVFPEWSHVDSHVPDLPEEAFMALQEEAKSRAMFKLKQMTDSKAEQEATRQQRWLARKAWTVEGGVRYPNYGRRGRK